ncbi:MAG: BrnT family toxin [Candidatus Brocadiales bacterium]|nr:BrnT family toxin [Candidatus Brocadiales bacterium]
MAFEHLIIDGFDWDEGNRDKCQKHGVSIPEIERLFTDDLLTVFFDEKHSGTEERLIAVGKGHGKKLILIVFTMRKKNRKQLIRPISARYMHRKEISYYEKEITDTEK